MIDFALEILISSKTFRNKNLGGMTQEEESTPARRLQNLAQRYSGRCSLEDYVPLGRERRKLLRPSGSMKSEEGNKNPILINIYTQQQVT